MRNKKKRGRLEPLHQNVAHIIGLHCDHEHVYLRKPSHYELHRNTLDVPACLAQYTWPRSPFCVTAEWTPSPGPLNPFQSKGGRQINTNLYYLCPVSTARSQVWAGGQKKSVGGGVYSGGIIVPVVVISAAATVITIRFDFIWECLHSCSPLTPLTPFSPLPFPPPSPPPPPLAPLPLD